MGIRIAGMSKKASDTTYQPLPSGTATAGQVPVATGVGNATAWGSSGARYRTPITSGTPVLGNLGHPGGSSGTNAFVDGTNIEQITQTQHRVVADCADLKLVFGNFSGYEYPGASLLSGDAPNDVYVSASVYFGCDPKGITGRNLAAVTAVDDTVISLDNVAGVTAGAKISFAFAAQQIRTIVAVDTTAKTVTLSSPIGYAYTLPGGATPATITIWATGSKVRFNGDTEARIGVNGKAVCETLGVSLPKSVNFGTTPALYVRTKVRVASIGQRWPAGLPGQAGLGTGVISSTTAFIRTVTDGAITSGTKTLTSATAAFVAGDVGKPVTVAGAGNGTDLYATIASVTNSTTVVLSSAQNTASGNAATTVSGATVTIGDYLDPNVFSNVTENGGNNGYHPIMGVASVSVALLPVLGIAGDSIAMGTGGPNGESWCALAANAAGYPYVLTARGGDMANLFAYPEYHRHRDAMLNSATTVLVEYGINDISQSDLTTGGRAALQRNLLRIWTRRARTGQRVIQSTLTPYTSSTDGYATATNQTPYGGEPSRVFINTWLRAGAPLDPTTLLPVAAGTGGAVVAGAANHPLYAVFDAAAAVEVNSSNVLTQNGGRWQAGTCTGDGLHPNSTGHTQIAATFPATLII